MLHLNPAVFSKDTLNDFTKSNGSLSATWSQRDDSLAIFPSRIADSQSLKTTAPNVRHIYITAPHQAPTAERRTFVTDTSVIFAAMQNFIKVASTKQSRLLQDDVTQGTLRKLTIDYVNFCKECWVYCSRDEDKREPLQLDPDHYLKLYSCLSLFCVLYLADSDLEDAPVGEELMEWLNRLYVEPSTEEADHLSSLDRPWEDDNFWSFLSRLILRGLSKVSSFFLELLSGHPSPHLQRLAEHLTPLLNNHPRLSNFATERDFAIASRRWKEKVKALRIELDRVPEDSREDGFYNWWERLSDIVGVLEGRSLALKRLCMELGADWKLVSIAWSIFVDPRLRRQDLPDVVAEILDELPPDPTNLEEKIHCALFLGKPSQVLSQAYRLDPWLSAHIADIMEPLDLIDRDPDDSGLTIRQSYLLSYTEYLRSDPGLWRLTVDYMCSCGPIGQEMADQVLIHVPLKLHGPSQHGEHGAEEPSLRSDELIEVLKEVNATCFDHKREVARRSVCKIAARMFLGSKEYGLAISYCTSAEDWAGLGRIVECVLEEYLARGPAEFARLVANIAPSLHTLRTQPANGVFLYRLMFAVRFAEFHQRRLNGDIQHAALDLVSLLRDDIAPKSWWAVALYDAVELLCNDEQMLFSSDEACLLLRKLEEICSRVAQGAGSDYLSVFTRSSRSRDEKHALQRLQVVRLALAKYYARCGVIGVGGRVNSVPIH